MNDRRVILIVMDSVGAGQMPDAGLYGDEGCHTVKHIFEKNPNLRLPQLKKLGFYEINGISDTCGVSDDEKDGEGGRNCEKDGEGGRNCEKDGGGDGERDGESKNIKGAYGRAAELSAGKDTITGHWEIAGVVTAEPFNTYTDNGFPAEFIAKFEEEIGRSVIGNYAASGTEIIRTLGDEHKKTGCPIVYTSADSVFQIAANIDYVDIETLYGWCRKARKLLTGKWLTGRVIARPFTEKNGVYTRISGLRHDYALDPPERTILDIISESGSSVYAIGKITDIFNSRGITHSLHTEDNADGMKKTAEAMSECTNGLIFTNLVDFDMKYGHRRDPEGYARALREFDNAIYEIIPQLRKDDILIICADHGNDPVHTGWNHTREYIPVMVYGKNVREGTNLGILPSFADIGATVCEYLGTEKPKNGKSFLDRILI